MIVTRRKYNDLIKASDAAVEHYRDLWKDVLERAADLAMTNRALNERIEQLDSEVEALAGAMGNAADAMRTGLQEVRNGTSQEV